MDCCEGQDKMNISIGADVLPMLARLVELKHECITPFWARHGVFCQQPNTNPNDQAMKNPGRLHICVLQKRSWAGAK